MAISRHRVIPLRALVFLLAVTVSTPVLAACLDISQKPTISATGILTRPILPGRPNYEDVRNGDEPEKVYILTLDSPFCVTGDGFAEDNSVIDRIQLIDEKFMLSRLVGKSIEVKGVEPFGSHTGHHHAPLLMTMAEADLFEDPATTTVQAFYLALEAGNGETAAMNVVPEKRDDGPLSAKALTNYYGNLEQPLKLLSVSSLGPNRFRAWYDFTQQDHKLCKGSSLVTTQRVDNLNLISSIKSETGC